MVSNIPLRSLALLVFAYLLSFPEEMYGQQSTIYPYGCSVESDRRSRTMSRLPVKCDTVSFYGASFVSAADFQGAILNDFANFRQADFEDRTEFYFAAFLENAAFTGVEFKEFVGFSEAVFKKKATFDGTRFIDDAIFVRTEFDSKVSFHSIFEGRVTFSEAKFKDNTSFFRTRFNGVTSFHNADFGSRVSFRDAQFHGKVEFNRTIFPDSLDFRDIISSVEIDLTYGDLNEKKDINPDYRSLIALEGADISKIKLNSDLFSLWFPGLNPYDSRDAEKIIDIYQDVLKKLEDEGLRRSYQVFDIEYRSFESWVEGRHISHFFNKYWWNYGYSKARIVWWSLGWLLLFTVMNFFYFDELMRSVYTIEQLNLDKSILYIAVGDSRAIGKQILKSLQFIFWVLRRFLVSLYYTSLIFFGLRMNFERLHKPSTNRAFLLMGYLFLVYVIGLFCTGYLVAILIIA